MSEFEILSIDNIKFINAETGEEIKPIKVKEPLYIDTKTLLPKDLSTIIKYTPREEDIKKIDKIYARMYGNKYINVNKGKELDKIIRIPTLEIDFWNDKSSFIYIWGWPGPDYNVYKYSDYGETWAFYP